jgi:hypothetical protein
MFNFNSIDTIIFTFPEAEQRKYRQSLLICMGLLVSALGLGMILNISDGLNQLVYFALLIALTLAMIYFYWYLRMLKNRIAVSPMGIAQIHPNLRATVLHWNEITSVKESKALQRIDLQDQSGKRHIRVEYQMNNFEILKSYIYARLKRHGHTLPPE